MKNLAKIFVAGILAPLIAVGFLIRLIHFAVWAGWYWGGEWLQAFFLKDEPDANGA